MWWGTSVSMNIASTKLLRDASSIRPVSLRRLSAFTELSIEDEGLVKRLKPHSLPAGSILTDTKQHPSNSWIVLSGWCARIRITGPARHQIAYLLLPGDTVNVLPAQWAGEHLPVMALSPVIAADAAELRNVMMCGDPRRAALVRACRRAGVLEQTHCLNTIMRLGQQTAYQRLAHLLLEVYARLESVGLAGGGRFQLPVTQDVLANTLGLSLVHLSRTLRQMRREGSIGMRPGQIELVERDALAAVAEFSPAPVWSR